ncbi:MAG TPA: S-methyl-5-thioribose-1-phosphate isomerase [Candidatus Bilamarchaeaceae archaeon]|nr:S-methyl-5-thioribose-1-phosphate isomerase [Candidatus Bilamarchaeaceae archaeon]
MNVKVKKIIADIKSLKIQGARNIAKSAVMALSHQIKHSKSKSLDSIYKELKLVGKELRNARPTEPMTRNSIDNIISYVLSNLKEKNVSELKKLVSKKEKELLKKMDSDSAKISEYGARLIRDGSVVLTHCHSSSVTNVLIKAKKIGKRFKVIAFETRPRYQGRKTVKELVSAGIDVTLAVDGAMELFMRKADLCLVGADSITSRGDLINKVGTSTLAHIAQMHDVSFYSVAELFKFSTKTIFGNLEEIEERDRKEVWEDAPRKLKIRNPAFDVTSAEYINGYVTEAGIIPPQSILSVASEHLGIKL